MREIIGIFGRDLRRIFQSKMAVAMMYPSMNAVRETVGGWLVIRRPIMTIKERISHEVEETGVII